MRAIIIGSKNKTKIAVNFSQFIFMGKVKFTGDSGDSNDYNN